MDIGLATGMGYVGLAALFLVVMAVFALILSALRFGAGSENERDLKITIPENLDYDGLFRQHLRSCRLGRAKPPRGTP